jgi:hypothetical protein
MYAYCDFRSAGMSGLCACAFYKCRIVFAVKLSLLCRKPELSLITSIFHAIHLVCAPMSGAARRIRGDERYAAGEMQRVTELSHFKSLRSPSILLGTMSLSRVFR